MLIPRARRTLLAGVAAGSLVAALGAPTATASPVAPGAAAAPTPLVASGPFSATATAALLTIDLPALTPALLPQTNVDIGRSTAELDSDGDLDAGEPGAQRAAALAGTTGSSTVLGGPLVVQENSASAPPSELNEQTLLQLPLEPLLDLDVVNTAAEANWISDVECVASTTPVSRARQEAADATVVAPDEDTSIVDLTAGDDGAVDVEASTGLPATGGQLDQRYVAANVNANIAGVDVLNNLVPDLLQVLEIDVVNAPDYTVLANGLPGGASVLGDDPVVAVTIAGQDVIVIEANEVEETPLLGLALGDLLGGLDPILGELQPIVRLSIPVERNASADGTMASVSAALLRIELLPPSLGGLTQPIAELLTTVLAALGIDITQPLGVIELAPMSATVVAPQGGITCGGDDGNPLEVQKTPSSEPAIRGSAFDYTIAIGNTGDCTLRDVVVTDVVTGPAGFDIVDTGGGTENPEGTVTWNVGDIPPDGRVTLRLRITVPANAPAGARFADHVESTGTCDGETIENEDDYDGPGVSDPTSQTCDLRGSKKASSHTEVYQGEQFVYFIHLFNSGATPCNDTDVVDTLDPRLTFVSCSDGCTVDGQRVTWNDIDLAAGQSITLSLVVEVNADATGELANTAQVDTPSDSDGPRDLTVSGPDITGRSVIAPPNPGGTPTPRGLARTGAQTPVLLALAAGLGALALARTRRQALG